MREIINQEKYKTKRMMAHSGFHSDASLEFFDDVARLFLLVPADKSIEHKDSNLNLRAE